MVREGRCFEVLVPSSGGTLIKFQGSPLPVALKRAREEAREQRRTVYVRNQLTGLSRPVQPRR